MHFSFYSVKINDTPLCQTVRCFKFHDLGSEEQGFFCRLSYIRCITNINISIQALGAFEVAVVS